MFDVTRTLVFVLFALLMTACGGGSSGGDSSGSDSSEDPASDNPVQVTDEGNNTEQGGDSDGDSDDDGYNCNVDGDDANEIASMSELQNELLPLTPGVTISYNDGTDLTVTESKFSSNSTATIFCVNYDSMTQYISSSPEEVLLYGIDGTFNIDDISTEAGLITDISFKNVRFSPPIPIWKKGQLITEDQILEEGVVTASLSAKVPVFGTVSDSPIYATVESSSTSFWFIEQYLSSPIGEFKSKGILLEIDITGNVNGFDFATGLTDRLYLVPGLGIVLRKANYAADDVTIDHAIAGIANLPHPITFKTSDANPTPTIPADTVEITYDEDGIFNVSGGAIISSEEYDIKNIDELNATGWISLIKDDISNHFSITMLTNNSTPVSSTSLSVLFENKATKKIIPANINLIVN